MKKLLTLISIIFFFSCDYFLMEEVKERYYNGKLKLVYFYKKIGDNKILKRIINYHENGQIKEEENYKDGKLNEISGTEKTWDAQLVLLSMGFVSPEHYLSEDAKINLDDRGNYKAEHGDYSTSKSGIFTAGDCR